MGPRYSILAAAVNTCLLSEVPLGEVLAGDDDAETELRPRFDETELRPVLRELLTSGFVRLYIDDMTTRVLSSTEALEVIDLDEWKGGRPFYTLITTPAGDAEFEREWNEAGRPVRFLSERTMGWEELAGP